MDSITQDGSTRGTNRSRSGRRLPEREVGGDGVKRTGSSSTSTATVERPTGKSTGGAGKGTSGAGNIDPENLNTINDTLDSDEAFNLELKKITKQGYSEQKTDYLIDRLKKIERTRNLQNLTRSSKNKLLPSLEQNIIQEILEDRQNLDANRIFGDIDPFSDTFTNQQLKAVANDFKALSGTNPVTQPKFPSTQIVPFDRGLQKGDLFDNLKRSLNSPKVRAAGFAALDVGFTALDFAQRKGSGQTNLQAGVGAGGGLFGGMVAQGVTAAALTKLAAASAITPIPGARPLALLLLLGAGMMGSMAGGDIADSLTGVNAGQEPKVKRDRRGKIKKSKPTPTQAPTAVEELPINSSEELEDEMIKEAFLSGALLNSGGTGMIQYVPVPFEVPVTVKVPVIPSSHWGYTLNGG